MTASETTDEIGIEPLNGYGLSSDVGDRDY